MEAKGDDGLDGARNAVERYLESTRPNASQLTAWEKKIVLLRKSGDLRGVVHCLMQICELPAVGLRAISDAANTLNSVIGSQELDLEWHEKAAVVNRVIKAMKEYAIEGDATDCSRLAWLYIRLGDNDSARHLTQQGLNLEPNNEYCLRLAKRLF